MEESISPFMLCYHCEGGGRGGHDTPSYSDVNDVQRVDVRTLRLFHAPTKLEDSDALPRLPGSGHGLVMPYLLKRIKWRKDLKAETTPMLVSKRIISCRCRVWPGWP